MAQDANTPNNWSSELLSQVETDTSFNRIANDGTQDFSFNEDRSNATEQASTIKPEDFEYYLYQLLMDLRAKRPLDNRRFDRILQVATEIDTCRQVFLGLRDEDAKLVLEELQSVRTFPFLKRKKCASIC
jgi:hypothetical protein